MVYRMGEWESPGRSGIWALLRGDCGESQGPSCIKGRNAGL